MHTHWSQFVPNMSTRHPRTLSSTSSVSHHAIAEHTFIEFCASDALDMSRVYSFIANISLTPYYRAIPYYNYRTIPYLTTPYQTIAEQTFSEFCTSDAYDMSRVYNFIANTLLSCNTIPYRTIPYLTTPYQTIAEHTFSEFCTRDAYRVSRL